MTADRLHTGTTSADQVGDVFAAVLRDWLTPAQFAAMKAANERPDQTPGSCASHDYCDANEAMAAAFRLTLGAPFDMHDDGQVALWNAAWASARRRHLGHHGIDRAGTSSEPAVRIASESREGNDGKSAG